MAERTVTLRIKRYRPERSPEPFYQEYKVPYRDDTVVLDALNHVKDEIDPTLTYRWSCRMGICGSCGMTVNGAPKLTCETFVREYRTPVITVGPLEHFPVMKDLVIDLTDFLVKLRGLEPYIQGRTEGGDLGKEFLQSPAEVERFRQQSLCINCMICYSACPVYGHEPEFLGPAALALAYRYNMDSRDRGGPERLRRTMVKDGIFQCTFVGECSHACPKEVDPAGAIQRLKIQGALATLLPRRGR